VVDIIYSVTNIYSYLNCKKIKRNGIFSISMEEIKIKKRDGKTETWMYDKVLASIGKTNVSLETAEDIAKKVEDWVKTKAVKGVIISTDVRDKITELLKEVDPVAGDNYQAYKAD